MNLTDCSSIVVGGAGGLGEATVRRLARAGAAVVVADLAEDRGKAIADELGSRVMFVRTDALDESSVSEAILVANDFGPLRVCVVAHAGPAGGQRIIGRDGKRYELSYFRRTVEIFLVGTFHVLSQAAESIGQQDALDGGGRGVIVTTASIAGYEGQIGQSDYAAAKGGVIGLTLTAARDLAPLGIRVMCIAPGTFFTPAYGLTEEVAHEKYSPGVPHPKRMGQPDEYAQLVVQIVENEYLNGEVIRIDGAQRLSPR